MREHLSSTRFNGSATGSLGARRASAHNVQRGIGVRVVGMPALDAFEGRLALAVLRRDAAAGRAGLRRVGGVDVLDSPAGLGELVFQLKGKQAPALFEDRSVEATLATPRAHHVRDGECFHGYGSKPARDVRAALMQPVLSNGSDMGIVSPYEAFRLSPSIGALHGARQSSLRPLPPTDRERHIGHLEMLARRKAESIRNAAVDAYAGKAIGWQIMFTLGGEGSIPETPAVADGDICNPAQDRPSYPHFDGAALGNAQRRPFSIELPNSLLFADDAERGVAFTIPVRGEICAAGEECAECSIEISKRLLAKTPRHVGEPMHFSAQVRQFSALTAEANRGAHCRAVLSPPITPLLKSQVVNEAARASVLAQALFLRRGRVKSIAERAENHRRFLSEFVHSGKRIGPLSAAFCQPPEAS